MNLREYATVVRRKWPVIVACALLAGAVMWVLTPANPPAPKPESYTATATLLVSSDGQPETGGSPSLARIALYIQSGEVPKMAAKELGFTADPALLASQVKVQQDDIAQALMLSSTNADGAHAAKVANTFATQSMKFFGTSRPGAAGARLSLLEEATPIANQGGSAYVIPPGRYARTGLGFLVGAILGFALGLLLHQFDSRLRSRDEVYAATRLPIVAEVPRLKGAKSKSGAILVASDALSPYADAYRAARAAVSHSLAQRESMRPPARGERGARTEAPAVLITSAQATEGKTTSTANLAASFAETGKRVLVLDADLRSPNTHVLFDVPQGAGISDYLQDPMGTPLQALIRPTSIPNVGIITAGMSLANPTALASRMGTLLAEARQLADVIIVDSAPLLEASDVFDILPMVDTVVMVVRSGRLTESAATRACELLRRFQIPVTGVVLIGVARKRSAGYGYGNGYGNTGNRETVASGASGDATRRSRRDSQK